MHGSVRRRLTLSHPKLSPKLSQKPGPQTLSNFPSCLLNFSFVEVPVSVKNQTKMTMMYSLFF